MEQQKKMLFLVDHTLDDNKEDLRIKMLCRFGNIDLFEFYTFSSNGNNIIYGNENVCGFFDEQFWGWFSVNGRVCHSFNMIKFISERSYPFGYYYWVEQNG